MNSNRIAGFYLGQLVELNESYKKGSTFPEELVKLQEKYGDIFKIQFLNNMMVAVLEPNAIKVKFLIINLYKQIDFLIILFSTTENDYR